MRTNKDIPIENKTARLLELAYQQRRTASVQDEIAGNEKELIIAQ